MSRVMLGLSEKQTLLNISPTLCCKKSVPHNIHLQLVQLLGKGKVFPYSLPSVGPGADPGVQAVSPQVT